MCNSDSKTIGPGKKPGSDLERAAELLVQGLLVAFPTETVYGLGGDATNDLAVAGIFETKGRPHFNPLIVHVASFEQARSIAVFAGDAVRLAETFWPGPLTLVVPRRRDCPVSLLASAGLDTVAIRVPAHPLARALLKAVDRPIVAPSANRSGRISPTTADHVRGDFGDDIAMILDGGPCDIGVESTIVGFGDDGPCLLRTGGVARPDLETVLGHPLKDGVSDPAAPAAPGQLTSHYAPRAAVRLEATDVREHEALLAFGRSVPNPTGPVLNLSPSGDLTEAAANLFAYLRRLDERSPDAIAVMAIPDHGLGEAINDRLRRAAAPRDEVAGRPHVAT